MHNCLFIPVKTGKFIPPKHDIYAELDKHLPDLHENDVVFITSKILAIHQGRCILKSEYPDRDILAKQEADYFIDRPKDTHGYSVLLTLKNNSIIASAGIDKSNSGDYYTLWPENLDTLISEIRTYLCNKYQISNLGVIATDSHTTPLRLGVSGMAIGLVGIKPLKNKVGTPDIFGQPLNITKIDQITPLTTMAVWYMGEGCEQTPICIARGDFPNLEFDEKASTKDFFVTIDEDVYLPLLEKFFK